MKRGQKRRAKIIEQGAKMTTKRPKQPKSYMNGKMTIKTAKITGRMFKMAKKRPK